MFGGGVALDASGHGESDDMDTDPGYETPSAYVGDVPAVAPAADREGLAGNSLGRAVCLHPLFEREVEAGVTRESFTARSGPLANPNDSGL